jgi:hypothetical protein
MNEELQQAILEVIQSMTGVAQSAYTLGAEQMPEVIEQLIVFNIVKNTAIIFIFFALCVLGACLIYKAYSTKPTEKADTYPNSYMKENLWWDKHGYASSAHVAVCLILGFSLLGFVLSVFVHGGFLLKLIIAPKVWLIEYAAGLVK